MQILLEKVQLRLISDCFLLNSVEELDKHIHDKDELRVEFSNTCCSLELFDICVYFDDFLDDCFDSAQKHLEKVRAKQA